MKESLKIFDITEAGFDEFRANPVSEKDDKEIIKEAEKLTADMIIIGSEHKGLWTQLIEGSTSKSLVGQSTVPVLVVPVKV